MAVDTIARALALKAEVGPSPDLTDYVKNTDYATATKAGIIKATNYLNVTSDGVAYASPITKEIYESTNPNVFIAKGTLENIKDDYVGSSNPVITLNNTLDNLVRKNRVSDYIVSLKDALKYKVFEFLVHGKVKQETTTGKNKLDYTYLSLNEEQSTLNGGSYTYENGLLEIDATKATNNMTIRSSNISNSEFVLKAGTYYAHVCINTKKVSDGTFTQYMAGQITLAEDVYINQWFVPCPKGTKENTILMIEPGNEKTEWEPYTGGQPSPSPDYPQPITTLNFDKITRCGKNLATENFANQNSTINLARTLKAGEKITIVLNMTAVDNPSTGYGMNIYDQNNEQLWGNSYTNWQPPYDGWNSFVVTVKNDTSILRINSYGYQEVEIPTAILSGALVEENKYIHDGSLYEPYQGQTYDIDLQGNEMVELPNGVKDELVIDKYGNVSLIKNIGKVILDGSENNWDWNMITEDEKYRFSTGVIQSLVEPSTPCLSNYFMSGSADDGDYFVENTIEIAPSGGITICTYAVSNSIEEFRAWLQEHNVIVYYQLANPQLIPLGTLSELITTLNGTNNIFINGNIPTTISITYALDIKKYIDNKLAEISSALIEEG